MFVWTLIFALDDVMQRTCFADVVRTFCSRGERNRIWRIQSAHTCQKRVSRPQVTNLTSKYQTYVKHSTFSAFSRLLQFTKGFWSSTLTLQVWDKYLSAVGQQEALDEKNFVASMQKLVNDPSLKPCLEGPLPLFFHAVDANDDHMISGDEYAQFFEVCTACTCTEVHWYMLSFPGLLSCFGNYTFWSVAICNLSAVNQKQIPSTKTFILRFIKLNYYSASWKPRKWRAPTWFNNVFAGCWIMVCKNWWNSFQILGLDPALAGESFKAIDTNGDGDISLDEFM